MSHIADLPHSCNPIKAGKMKTNLDKLREEYLNYLGDIKTITCEETCEAILKDVDDILIKRQPYSLAIIEIRQHLQKGSQSAIRREKPNGISRNRNKHMETRRE